MMNGSRLDDARRALEVHRAFEAVTVGWHDSHQGLRDLVYGLGAVLGCPGGSVWAFDAAGQALVCRDVAGELGVGPVAEVGTVLAVGEGVPGRAWESGAPIAGTATASGGQGDVLAFPIEGARGVIAVVALHADSLPELGADLEASLSSVGRALGSFIEGRHDPVAGPLLSSREIDVLQLAADGLTGPAIADELLLSRLTVKSHFSHIYRKLGTTDRANAVAHAMRRGLIR